MKSFEIQGCAKVKHSSQPSGNKATPKQFTENPQSPEFFPSNINHVYVCFMFLISRR